MESVTHRKIDQGSIIERIPAADFHTEIRRLPDNSLKTALYPKWWLVGGRLQRLAGLYLWKSWVHLSIGEIT